MTRGRVLTRPELKCVQNHQGWRREGTEPYLPYRSTLAAG